MGRRKLVMKRIEDKSSRQVTFSKRRAGLIKKARELSVLCDVQVALLVFSNRGRLYESCNGGSSFHCSTWFSLTSIIERYQSHSEGKEISKSSNELEENQSERASRWCYADLLQIVKRQVDGPDIEQSSLTDLMQLQEQLDAALAQIRYKKTQQRMDYIMTLREQKRTLKEENELLEQEVSKLINVVEAQNKVGLAGAETSAASDHHHQWATLNLLH